MSDTTDNVHTAVIENTHRAIGGDWTVTSNDGLVKSFSKAFMDQIPGSTRQDSMLGRKEHPFNFTSAGRLKQFNVHHSACIDAKVESTVGQGFRRDPVMETVEQATPEEQAAQDQANVEADRALKEKEIGVKAKVASKKTAIQKAAANFKKALVSRPKVDPVTGKPKLEPRSKVAKSLDPLCRVSFQDVLVRCAQDYWQTGNAYLEVVRDNDDAIVALYHMPSRDVFVVLEDTIGNEHYEAAASDGSSFTRVYARFRDRDRLVRAGGEMLNGTVAIPKVSRPRGRPRKTITTNEQLSLSELIHFPKPSTFSRFYGFPDWLAAILAMELKQCSTQHLYDFFLNRGVPELLIVVSGGTVNKTEWTAFQNTLKNHIGMGKSHKTMALNLSAKDVKTEVHKLAMEGKTDDLYPALAEVLASEIISAHGTPPLLAGVQIPGKLGANNELANALVAFHYLRIAPAQDVFQTVLMNTLGREDEGLGVPEDSWELSSILDRFDLGKVDTLSRMRQPITEAQSQGRNLADGLKE